MTIDATAFQSEVDLIDVRTEARRSVRPVFALVAATIAAACFWFVFSPQYYVSTSIIETVDNSVEPVLRSAVVLDPVLKAFPEPLASKDAQREALESRIRIVKFKSTAAARADQGGPSYELSVLHSDPQTAQSINQALINSWRAATIPKSESATKIEVRIADVSTELTAVNSAIAHLEGELSSGRPAEPLATLYEQRLKFRNEIDLLKEKLNGIDADTIVSEPTLPDRASNQNKGLLLALSIIATFLTSAVFLVSRQTNGRH